MSAVKRKRARLAARRKAWDKRHAKTLFKLLQQVMRDENLRDHLFVAFGIAWIDRVKILLDSRP